VNQRIELKLHRKRRKERRRRKTMECGKQR
jgi:hypothetical protein